MGVWEDFKVLKKFKDDIWASDPIVTNFPYFQYKYAILNTDRSVIRYESGINRLADLNLLDGDSKDEKLINFGHKFGGVTEIFSPRSVKYV